MDPGTGRKDNGAVIIVRVEVFEDFETFEDFEDFEDFETAEPTVAMTTDMISIYTDIR